MTRLSLIFFHEHNVSVEPSESEGATHSGQKHHGKDMIDLISFKDGTSQLLKSEGMMKTKQENGFPILSGKTPVLTTWLECSNTLFTLLKSRKVRL